MSGHTPWRWTQPRNAFGGGYIWGCAFCVKPAALFFFHGHHARLGVCAGHTGLGAASAQALADQAADRQDVEPEK